MTDKQRCILSDYRADKCAHCSDLCGHRIAMHGLDGKGGRTAYAGIPSEYRHVTIKTSPVRNSQAKVYDMLDAYISTFKRHINGGERAKSLYLWSESPGTGKTTTASALANAWIAAEYLTYIQAGKQPPSNTSAVFLDVNEFQTQYNLATMTKDDEGIAKIGSEIKRTQEANFAVLDDIGVRGATEAFRSYVHAIINQRTVNGLPTVYTSNLPIEDMAKVFDERLYDRMRDQCAEIHFAGESKRGRR